MINYINKLAREHLNQQSLDSPEDRPAIPEELHEGFEDAIPAASSTGDGISWPLTEEDASLRTEFSTVHELTSTDGTIVLEYQNTNKIVLTDAAGNGGDFILADPDV